MLQPKNIFRGRLRDVLRFRERKLVEEELKFYLSASRMSAIFEILS